MEHLRLSDGEWKLMKTLWQRQPCTLAELVAALDAEIGWSRATIFMMLKRLIAKGADIPQATAATQPVIYQSHNLFIPYLGYGSFIMPAIIIVIIQQTLLIGIGMIGGTWREFGLYRKLIPANCKRMYTLPIVLGKALVYISIYAVTLLYIMTVHYKLFH